MADWQGELEALLARLSVSLEMTEAESGGQVPERAPTSGDLAELAADLAEGGTDCDAFVSTSQITADETGESQENVEVSAVRSEIEATLRQIVVLANAGSITPALRDDVIFVLRALTRPRPVTRPLNPQRAGDGVEGAQEWQLASAAAVLRFCRIVSRLTNSLARGPEV
jgi:hypothetical protein